MALKVCSNYRLACLILLLVSVGLVVVDGRLLHGWIKVSKA
jgi:hypothetical protein